MPPANSPEDPGSPQHALPPPPSSRLRPPSRSRQQRHSQSRHTQTPPPPPSASSLSAALQALDSPPLNLAETLSYSDQSRIGGQARPSTVIPPRPPRVDEAFGIVEEPQSFHSTFVDEPDWEHSDDDANADNIRFLREPLPGLSLLDDPQAEWRAQNAAAAAAEAAGADNESDSARSLSGARSRATLYREGASDMERQSGARTPDELDRARRERLQRVLQRLSRIHDAFGERGNNTTEWRSSGRPLPDSDSESYGIRPDEEHEDAGEREHGSIGEPEDEELRQIVRELRRQQSAVHPDLIRVLGRTLANSETRRSREAPASTSRDAPQHNRRPAPQQSESSLRSTAILQSVRRHPRFSARSRDYMQRYIMDRERAGTENDERDRLLTRAFGSGESRYEASRLAWQQAQAQQRQNRRTASPDGWNVSEVNRESRRRLDDYRRAYLDNPTNTSYNYPSTFRHSHPPGQNLTPCKVEQAIKYLADLRHSTSYQESMRYAKDAGVSGFQDQEDFIVDPGTLPAPAQSSWLAPGAVFTGSQHATAFSSSSFSPAATAAGLRGGSTSTTYRFRNDTPLTSTTFDSNTNPGPGDRVKPVPSSQDSWPVKVTIHAVDWENMTLSATMEAFDVPSQPSHATTIPSLAGGVTSFVAGGGSPHSASLHSPSYLSNTDIRQTTHLTQTTETGFTSGPRRFKTSSITTYLEGELIDFRYMHSLLTESFASSSATDALYWRKLEPFASAALTPHQASSSQLMNIAQFDPELLPREDDYDRPPSGGVMSGITGRSNRHRDPSDRQGSSTWHRPPSSRPPTDKGDAELAKKLMSKQWMNQLGDDWVIMRWKERCFVKTRKRDQESQSNGTPNRSSASGRRRSAEEWEDGEGCGLTISGFYYVCLNRKNGAIEGLYYDPQSSPYQYLRLTSERPNFPRWEFR